MRTKLDLAILALAAACVRAEVPDCADTAKSAPDADPLQGVERIGWDKERLGSFGLVVASYEMTEEHPGRYRRTDGGNPRFHVIATEDAFAAPTPQPVLLWLHGGVAGVDGVEDEAGVFCTQDGIQELVDNAIDGHPFLLGEIASRDWVMVVPETTWCDLWVGLGPDDPVDTRHASLDHVDWTLRAVEAGLDGVQVDPDQYFLWGTSIGGSGTWPQVLGLQGSVRRFAGLVADSGPAVLTEWAETRLGGAYTTHVLGGPPFDANDEPALWYPNYQRTDGHLLMAEKGVRTPAFLTYNSFDRLTPAIHGTILSGDLDELYAPEGVRYFHHDFDHHGPGEMSHTQSVGASTPYDQTTMAALEFLIGRQVALFEAEILCPTCTVAREQESDDWTAWVSRYSEGAAVTRSEGDGAGRLFQAILPVEIPVRRPVSIMVLLDATDTGKWSGSDLFATIVLRSDKAVLAERDVSIDDLVVADSDVSGNRAKVAATTLVIGDVDGDGKPDGLPDARTTLEIDTSGRGTAWLDGFWAIW
jgi:hypothetical protein